MGDRDGVREFRLGAIAAYPRVRPISHLLGALWDVRTPSLRTNSSLGGLPNGLELPIALDLTNEHRLMQVMILGVERDVEARRRAEGLVSESLPYGVDVRRSSLRNALWPHV